MGLDIVELVMAIEDTFEISINDPAAEKILTVGDLHAFVMSRLPPSSNRSCLTSHAFYRIRSALVEQAGSTRSCVTPGAPLAKLLPVEGRREAWSRLSATLDWRFPDLERPRIFHSGIPTAALAAIPVLAILAGTGLLSLLLALLVAAVVIVAMVVVQYATEPLAVHLPSSCTTVGEATQTILRLNFAEIAGSVGARSEREVWSIIQGIVVDQLGVTLNEVVPEARFVDDLGAD